jgi:hypothetical protein
LIVGNRGVTGDASVPATIPNITTSDNEAFIFTLKQLFYEKNKAEYKRLELAQSSRTFKDEYWPGWKSVELTMRVAGHKLLRDNSNSYKQIQWAMPHP